MISRRKVFKLLGLTPLAAPMAAKTLADQTLISTHGGMIAGRGLLEPVEMANPAGPDFLTFSTFTDWLGTFGEDKIRQEAEDIQGMDPEIMLMHVPMTTKVRMQRERNYRRIKARRQRRAENVLAAGGHLDQWF